MAAKLFKPLEGREWPCPCFGLKDLLNASLVRNGVQRRTRHQPQRRPASRRRMRSGQRFRSTSATPRGCRMPKRRGCSSPQPGKPCNLVALARFTGCYYTPQLLRTVYVHSQVFTEGGASTLKWSRRVDTKRDGPGLTQAHMQSWRFVNHRQLWRVDGLPRWDGLRVCGACLDLGCCIVLSRFLRISCRSFFTFPVFCALAPSKPTYIVKSNVAEPNMRVCMACLTGTSPSAEANCVREAWQEQQPCDSCCSRARMCAGRWDGAPGVCL